MTNDEIKLAHEKYLTQKGDLQIVSQQQCRDIVSCEDNFLKVWWIYTENYVEDILTVSDTDVYMWSFLSLHKSSYIQMCST